MKVNAPDVYHHWTEPLCSRFVPQTKSCDDWRRRLFVLYWRLCLIPQNKWSRGRMEFNKLQTKSVRGGPESPTRQCCHCSSATHCLRNFTKWISKMSCFLSAKDINLGKNRGASTVNNHTIFSQRTSLIQNSETANCVFGDASNRVFPYQAHINYGIWTLLVSIALLQSFQNRTVI